MSGASLRILLSSAAIWAGMPVFAQDNGSPPDEAAAPSTAASAAPIEEELVVTARRRAETTLTTPLSVTALDGQALSDAGVRRLEDLAIRVPNLRQSTGGPNTFNFIRGVGSGSNAGFEQAVGVFVDEIYLGRGTQAHLPFFDMQQVEVLRGPQVLFLGNSTTGGAIAFTTRRPGNDLAVDADASYEFNNQELVLNAGLDAPLAEGAAVRLAGFYQDLSRGWLRSTVNGAPASEPRFENLGLRGVVDLEPSDRLSLTLKLEHLDMRQLGNTLQPVTNLLNNPAIVESVFDNRRVVGRPAPFAGGLDQRDLEQQSYLARAELDLGFGTLVSTSGYVTYDFFQTIEADLTPAPIIDFRQFEQYEQLSQELRLAGNISRNVDYLVGAYYQRDELDTRVFIDANVPPARFTGGRRSALDQRTRTLSGFVSLTVRPVDKLEVSAGARYTNVRKTADQSATPVDVVTGAPNPALDGPVFRSVFGVPHVFNDLRLSEDAFMPQLSVQYFVAPDVMLFGRAVRGEKSGGFDPLYAADLDRARASFAAEEATSYEGGLKGSFAERRFSFALTGFYTKLDDLQVSTFNGSTNYIVGNAARARSQGFELEGTWRPSPQVTLGAVAGYTDFEYLDFRGAGCTSQQNVAQPVGCSQDLSGSTGPFVSKWTATFNAAVRQPIGDYELELTGSYSYRSAYNPSPSIDPLLRQDGFGLLDARLELSAPAGWKIGIFGRNLTNNLFGEAGADVPGIRGATYLTTSRRRQIGIKAAVEF